MGVTVLEANGEFDAGPVWATRTFEHRSTTKTGLSRHEVRRAATEALVEAVTTFARGRDTPDGVEPNGLATGGRARPLMRQETRMIDWSTDPTDVVLRKIRAAEGQPGVLDGSAAASSTCSVPMESEPFAAARGRSSPSATARSAAPQSTPLFGSATSSSGGSRRGRSSSCLRPVPWRSPERAWTPRKCRYPSACRPGREQRTPSATSSTTRREASDTCISTSTTAR
jgi:hypothetical protein